MARRATLVICNHPGCRRVTQGRYCGDHNYKAPKRTRDPFLDSAAWKRMSKAKLAEHPWCEECHRGGKYIPAIDVDHVKPRSTHPHLSLTYANLESLCLHHHGIKTRKGL